MCFLAYFFSVHLVPETANVSLEEIDTMFRSAIGQEERAVRKQVIVLVPSAALGVTDD
jgi:hypothetical protein